MLNADRVIAHAVALVAIAALIILMTFSNRTHAGVNSASVDDQSDATKIERGRYLTAAANCEECHTTKNGAAFAGGRELKTPFGKILSANITPDHDTGIGAWSAEQFYAALHFGVEPDGTPLYPAFPYNYFTKITRNDSDAIFAYLRTVNPIKQHVDRDQLPFPFRIRGLMGLWNALFFKSGVYQVDASQSAEWNRGAYLVQALGHCGGCHTPLNIVGTPKTQHFLQGGSATGWFAPDLSSNQRIGVGAWSEDDLVEFLKTGRNSRAAATVDMGGVVTASTSHLEDSDLHAIANYLHSIPATNSKSISAADAVTLHVGEAIYIDECSACHAINGEGVALLIPPLQANANVQQHDAHTIVRYILWGVRATPTDARPTPSAMPNFAWKLDDEQVAAVANYIRNTWGNQATQVTAKDVRHERRSIPRDD